MGVVLEALDVPLQRRVAVKLMAPERANSEEARKRFLREARAAVRLSSEHVTRLLDVGELHDGTPFLVMEYLEGVNLEVVLMRDGPPRIDVAVDWVLQALDGVAEAHRAGLVHRDLKPENLFLCERPGRPPIVKVLDFGTVKDLVTKGTKLTRTGSTMGSPAYMPPEQVRAEEIDQRADVWAMGVTLYELLTGHLPFGGQSVVQTLAAILRDEPVPLRSRCPAVPSELEAIVTCALSKSPAARYASANELLAALAGVRAKMPRTTRATRTVHMGRNLALPRPEAFADTTDMNQFSELDASRVRRVPVSALAHPPTPPPAAQSRASAYLVPILLGLAGAVAIAVIGGFILARRHSPRPAEVTVTAPATNLGAAPPVTADSSPAAAITPSGAMPPATPHRPRPPK